MKITSYGAVMTSSHELTSLKRQGTAYVHVNESSKDALGASLQDNGGSKTVTKVTKSEFKGDRNRTDALTGKLAAGLLKRIADAVNNRNGTENFSKYGAQISIRKSDESVRLSATQSNAGDKFEAVGGERGKFDDVAKNDVAKFESSNDAKFDARDSAGNKFDDEAKFKAQSGMRSNFGSPTDFKDPNTAVKFKSAAELSQNAYESQNLAQNPAQISGETASSRQKIQTNLTLSQSSDAVYNSAGRLGGGYGFTSALRTYEEESVSFSIKAKVQTQDKDIDVNLSVNLKRSFVELTKFTRAEMGLSDPLVVSLNGQMPGLSSEKFEFDIDSDGKMWQISKLREGSGFLALDKNENGKIDDGSELFGVKSGDGFSDLAAFDDDGNGWIDKNDKIFSKLRIWQKTDAGDKLVALGETGIGAIFLGSVKSEFALGDVNKTGRLRQSGFFLKESGEAGLVTQIDLVKTPKRLNLKDIASMSEFDRQNLRIEGVKIGSFEPPNLNETAGKFIEKITAMQENLSSNFIKPASSQRSAKNLSAFEMEMRETKKAMQIRLNSLKSRLAKASVVNQKTLRSQIANLQRQIAGLDSQVGTKI